MPTSLGGMLKRAMTVRNVNNVELARAVGTNSQTISNYRRGKILPPTPRVASMAEVLGWPSLVDINASIRRRSCPVCDQEFFDDTTAMNRMYCTMRCCRTARARVKRGDVQVRYVITQRRLDRHVDAVRAMCYSCVTDMICRQGGCPLRPVSPFPLAPAGMRNEPILFS